MSLAEVVVEGTLKPDGTLELDHRPDLTPGRVTVVLRQEVASVQPQPGWWSAMQTVRKEMEDAGCHFADEKEIQARIDSLREDDRIDELLRNAGQS